MFLSNKQGELLRSLRGKQSILQISVITGIDPALLSKYETGKRRISDGHLKSLSQHFSESSDLIIQAHLRDQIIDLLSSQPNPESILSQVKEDISEYSRVASVDQSPKHSKQLTALLEKADQLKNAWNQKRPLDAFQLEKLRQYFHLNYTYQSNQIEGNTLTLQETKLVIEEGMTISGKSLREHLEAINHQNAILLLEELVQHKKPLNKSNLLQLHRIILFNIANEHAGVFRSVPVRITGSSHMPPQPYLLDKLMEDYFLFYSENRNSLHPILLAAEMHERLVSIHPFIDGNGRTSRLIMNLILLQAGYSLASIKGDSDSRLGYYHALEDSRTRQSKESFYQLIAITCIESLQEHLSLV